MTTKKKITTKKAFDELEAALEEARVKYFIEWQYEVEGQMPHFPFMCLIRANDRTFMLTCDWRDKWRAWQPTLSKMDDVPTEETLGAVIAAMEAP